MCLSHQGRVSTFHHPLRQQGTSGVLDYGDGKTRASLAQTFELECNGREWWGCPALTLVVNHLKSKGSDCDEIDDPDIGDGQARKHCYSVFVTHQVTHFYTPEFSRSLL